MALALVAPAAADIALHGSWTGNRDGVTVSWDLTNDGRLRIDGRGADYSISGDSLFVRFDPIAPGTPPESAVYLFAPEAGSSRLFVYGFDLGKQGLLLYRTPSEDVAEDAAPPEPPPPPIAPGGR
jgi:hypothetical protein